MRRTVDVGCEFIDDGFEYLVDPSSKSLIDTASRRCKRPGFLKSFMYLGGDVKRERQRKVLSSFVT